MSHYASKLLLFGEHIVIKGARALAVPYPSFQGRWAFAPESLRLQQDLSDFLAYLKEKNVEGVHFDLDSFEKDLSDGLFFDSNIPVGYGLGSSGALCAAVYDRYALQKIENREIARFQELQQLLAQMEGFFHTSSSGVDPLICYLGEAMLLQAGQSPAKVNFSYPSEPFRLFLIDTHQKRSTGSFVAVFLKKYEKIDFRSAVLQQLIPANEAAIDAFLGGQQATLWQHFQAISHFQLIHFTEMIPSSIHHLWEEGLRQGHYALKLCGAGGGGFILGLAREASALKWLKGIQTKLLK